MYNGITNHPCKFGVDRRSLSASNILPRTLHRALDEAHRPGDEIHSRFADASIFATRAPIDLKTRERHLLVVKDRFSDFDFHHQMIFFYLRP